MNSEIFRKIEIVVREVFENDEIEITPDTSAKDVPGWDSLGNIRFILELEKVFKIRFSTSEVGGHKNIGSLVSLVSKKFSINE